MRGLLLGLLLVGLGACTPAAAPRDGVENVQLGGVTMIRVPRSDLYPSGLGGGVVAEEGGCLGFGEGARATVFVLWPDGYSLREGLDGPEVVDEAGILVAGLGESVQLGGGYVELPAAQDLTDGGVPADCEVEGERYFLAAPEAWPLATTPDGSATLLRHRGTELSSDQALLTGTLGTRGGCVAARIGPDGEPGPYLVWPRDYTVRDPAPSDGFDVIAPDGHVAATEGEPIRLGGGYAPVDAAQMPGGIPEACRASGEAYWMVGAIEG